ncbi:MAG: hypothetical protein HYY04_03310, partial [Chloroflexi bacterium]|nr:hypothetical protein [Chloroflexota bacterium]
VLVGLAGLACGRGEPTASAVGASPGPPTAAATPTWAPARVGSPASVAKPTLPVELIAAATRIAREDFYPGCPSPSGTKSEDDCAAALLARDHLAARLRLAPAAVHFLRHEELPATRGTRIYRVVLLADAREYRYRVWQDAAGRWQGDEEITSPSATPETAPPAKAELPPDTVAAANRLRRLIGALAGPVLVDRHAEVTEAFAAALRSFVAADGDGDAESRAALQNELTVLATSPPTILTTSAVGDPRRSIVASLGLSSVPVLVAERVGNQVWVMEVPPGRPDASTIARIQAVADLTGDRSAEVVITWTTQGASAAPVRILVLGWTEAGLRAQFDQTISNWAGPASWQLTPPNRITISCLAFGVYDHKLLTHPQQRQFWAWDGKQFVLREQQTDTPTIRRQMVNLAEAAFTAGRFDQAADWFRGAAEFIGLADEPNMPVDWRGYSRFRRGQLFALQGKRAVAITELKQAEMAEEPLRGLAKAFRATYEARGVAAAFAAIQTSDYPGRVFRETAGNLAWPIDAETLGALGWGLAAIHDRLPAGTAPTAANVAQAAKQAGLTVVDPTVVDLDGDGNPEVAAILPFGERERSLWLLHRRGDEWLPRRVLRDASAITGASEMPNKRHAIQVRPVGPRDGSERPPDAGPLVGWDGKQPVRYQNGTAQPLPPVLFGDQCQVAEDLPLPPTSKPQNP